MLEAVFELHFYDGMMGFRPGRGCHKAIQKLNGMLKWRPTNYVLDADIRNFFGEIDHEWAARFVESRVISNIYMHYVLVWWFEERIRPILKGYGGLVAYADDFAACFQYKEDAEMFYKRLIKRMKHFGMSLEEEKTRLIEFGRNAQEHCGRKGKKPETFTFLGFTHYCSQGKNGKFRVKRKTSRKKFAKKCKEVHRQIKGMRNQSLEEIIKKLNQILVGYYHYCGITDDGRSISNFRYCVTKSLKYWLNRRTQRKSYTWEGFNEMLKQYPLAPA